MENDDIVTLQMIFFFQQLEGWMWIPTRLNDKFTFIWTVSDHATGEEVYNRFGKFLSNVRVAWEEKSSGIYRKQMNT